MEKIQWLLIISLPTIIFYLLDKLLKLKAKLINLFNTSEEYRKTIKIIFLILTFLVLFILEFLNSPYSVYGALTFVILHGYLSHKAEKFFNEKY